MIEVIHVNVYFGLKRDKILYEVAIYQFLAKQILSVAQCSMLKFERLVEASSIVSHIRLLQMLFSQHNANQKFY